jgi:hypothetical protein
MIVKEYYSAKPMAANSIQKVGAAIAGFLPTAAGTLTVTDADTTVLVNAVAVTIGVFVRIPLMFNTSSGGSVSLAGGAAGTLFC